MRPAWPRAQNVRIIDFAQVITSFFRSCGLDIIGLTIRNALRRRLHHDHDIEPRKPVLTKSRWLALSRCAVHILPILVTIVLVSVNLSHVYIGNHIRGGIFRDSDDTNLALLQITAKIQELLVVGSTGAILFHIIRSELIDGEGVPLGLIGAGLRFSGLSFFWSPEFLCALRYRGRMARKILVVVSILIAGLLAVVAGPASAVLMVPRAQDWPAGGTPFYLDGRELEIWPDRLDFDAERDLDICKGPDAPSLAYCPSGGLNTLISHYEQVDMSAFRATGALPYQGTVAGARYFYRVDSPDQKYPEMVAIGNIRQENADQISFIAQSHVMTSVFQRQLTLDWFDAARNKTGTSIYNKARYWRNWNIESRVSSHIPTTFVQCSQAQNVSTGGSVSVEYPTVPFEQRQTSNAGTTIPANDTEGSTIVASWTDLDPVTWSNTTTGLLILFPDANNTTALAVGCSIQATWLAASTLHDVSTSYAINPYNLDFSSPQYINISRSWLDLLVPPLEGDASTSSSSSNTLSYLLSKAHVEPPSPNETATSTSVWNSETFPIGGNRTTYIESIVASLFTDGLSRLASGTKLLTDLNNPTVGSNLLSYRPLTSESAYYDAILQGHPPALQRPAQDAMALRINITIPQAWGYSASSTTDYLAIAALLFHAMIALLHICWCLTSGVTSNCWDSVTELLALAQNSRPTKTALRNTGAGVEKGLTFRRKARVRVRRDDYAGEGIDERVELIYDDPHDDETFGEGQQDMDNHTKRHTKNVDAVAVEKIDTPDQAPLEQANHERVSPSSSQSHVALPQHYGSKFEQNDAAESSLRSENYAINEPRLEAKTRTEPRLEILGLCKQRRGQDDRRRGSAPWRKVQVNALYS